jgi:HK97 family phage major capsid protein
VDRAKLEARLQAIAEEAARLIEEQRSEADLDVSEQDEEKFAEREGVLEQLAEERVKIDAQLKRLDRLDKLAEDKKHLVEGVDLRVSQNSKKDPFDLNDLRWNMPTSELRARAKTAVEEVESYMTDDQKEAVSQKLSKVDDPRGIIPNLVIRTGNSDYRRAFQKAMAGRQDLWTHDERTAVADLEEFRTAMSLSDTAGGFAVPFTLDPTLILTNAGTVNPVRQLARVEPITTDSWNGLSSAGVDAEWLAENTEAADASPTLAQPTVPVHKAAAFVQGSIEISQDYQAIESDLSMAIADGKDRLEGAAFINGTGSGQPTGIITALDGGASEVAPATGETFAVADIYATQQALPPRFRGQNPSWLAELSTINEIRQFATANNYHGFLTDLRGDSPAVMLGKDLFESSDMDAFSDVDDTETDGNNHILLFGAFRNYLIADRIGFSLEFIPHMFATGSNRPSGTRGWFGHWRVGADSLVDDAFRVLHIPTTA